MRSHVLVALLGGLVLGCVHRSVEADLGDVHPGVFAMVPCWLSDTASPVVTEVNLDAAATNRNQFGEITRDRGWVRVDAEDGRSYMRYRALESRPPRYRIAYQENGGGTLATSVIIEIEVGTRVLEIDGVANAVRVMRVLSIEAEVAPNKPLQPTSGARAPGACGSRGAPLAAERLSHSPIHHETSTGSRSEVLVVRRAIGATISGVSAKVDIRTLTAEERLTLVGDIWDSLAPTDVPVSQAQRDELDRRLDDLAADPVPGIPWDDILRKLRDPTGR